MRRTALLASLCATTYAFAPHHIVTPNRVAAAAVAEAPSAAEAKTADAFVASLRDLTALDGLRAIDAAYERDPSLTEGTAPYVTVLERVDEADAPAAAVGALVGHAMARAKRAGVTPDDALLTALAPALLKARKNKECLGAVEAIRRKEGPAVRCGVVAASRLGDAGRVKSFVDLAVRTDEGVAMLDDATVKTALRAVSKAGDHRTAFAIVDGLPAERRSAPLYHGAIAACGRARPIKGKTAMLLWRRMKAENMTVPRQTYNALLHAAQGSLTENATTALLAEMSAQGVTLNVISYNIALNSLASAGRFGEVLDLLETMESSSIAPTEVTFGTAINGAARANNSAAAVALLRAQEKVGLALGDPAFASALEACLRDPDAKQASARAAEVLDVLADARVDLKRRERIESLARAAVGRDRGAVDPQRIKRDEEILGMVLQNRQAEV